MTPACVPESQKRSIGIEAELRTFSRYALSFSEREPTGSYLAVPVRFEELPSGRITKRAFCTRFSRKRYTEPERSHSHV